ncbi:stage III sporulation protein AA [Heyndrickxia ginsengihumi]|uniref:Stage III sporulation protein AA n=1 Tax=Heyndrickxia ginsengihumi TaxID=363870 RepID=A0A0A6VH75_9BACI|nr:stage III sporulation protein AA [Heyndrickxia ginsengihumi]KHD85979.1 stage III sporulation protein AA [Heyndrickxia ginsengihumi]MBE6182976.1 stage III sporulation protein AA [Bacillus sp. (in: firmicutes)]MCM3022801.1 stage III sporulation protein AA [Heyndrickxia ginsengihumi]NEY20068.1 stage III sporulation protein AA [Heyndrickxia ginsengihumi]
MEDVLECLPRTMAEKITELPEQIKSEIEEIRIRVDRPLEVMAGGNPVFLRYIPTEHDAEHLMNRLAHFSFYTLEEELKKGYITIEGGHRVGIAGKVILENGQVKAIRHFSSFNIRIAREKIGIAQQFTSVLYKKRWLSTMIIGAPQTGKTTFLRDIARIISTGVPERNIPPYKVGIVDERSEIAGCVHGIPQLHFGPRVDVLDACPKAEGMMMLIRSMSPDVLIVDEIGREEDAQAILEAVNAGISLIMTTHGDSIEDIKKRPILKNILDQQTFQLFIELIRKEKPGIVAKIRDSRGLILKNNEGGLHV